MLPDAALTTDRLVAVMSVASFVAGMIFERILSELRRWKWRARKRRWEGWSAGKTRSRGWWTGSRSPPGETSRKGDVLLAPWAVAPEPAPVPSPTPTKPVDAADQLRIILASSFTIQPLLNKSETRVLHELDRIVNACNPAWRVMAQVSLGEILSSKDLQAYSCINAKRVDLLLVDGDCKPRLAIEYQGGSHHQGDAAARDAVKKEALRRAGVGYLEVMAGQTTPLDLRLFVERFVDKPETPK